MENIDDIDFEKMKVETKNKPNFKTRNAFFRWRTLLTCFICLAIMVTLGLLLRHVVYKNSEIISQTKESSDLFEEISKEYYTLNTELEKEKEKNKKIQKDINDYKHAKRYHEDIQKQITISTDKLTQLKEKKKQISDEVKKVYNILKEASKNYQELEEKNQNLKKEYFNLGGH